MQGVILERFRVYIARRYGYRAWLETLKRSGWPATHQYTLDRIYPDEELDKLAQSAAEVTRTPLVDLMEGFRQALEPDM